MRISALVALDARGAVAVGRNAMAGHMAHQTKKRAPKGAFSEVI
jgi:hypothetical protein